MKESLQKYKMKTGMQENLYLKRLQLWSNRTNSEYAIHLEGKDDILAATSTGVLSTAYTELVEAEVYVEDSKYDWKYILLQ